MLPATREATDSPKAVPGPQAVNDDSIDFEDLDYAGMESHLARGRPSEAPEPATLMLDQLHVAPLVFQHRSYCEAASESHIRDLTRALQGQMRSPFPALTVYWAGDRWAVLDGHHRFAAYDEAGWSRPVPVHAFKGTLAEATTLALAANAKDKLPMSPRDKGNGAWKLVLLDALSIREIARASTMSERTVSYMRSVLKQLEERGRSRAELLAAGDWMRARKLLAGNDEDFDPDDYKERESDKLAKKLVKHLGPHYRDKGEIVALALMKYDERLAGHVCEELSGLLGGDEEENSDF